MDKQEVPTDIKVVIDQKINSCIVNAMGLIPEALTLSQEMQTITCYEDYQRYIAKLNQYHVVTNGIVDYISAAQKIKKKTNTVDVSKIDYNKEVEELAYNTLKKNRKGIIHIDKNIPYESVMAYAKNLWMMHNKLIFIQPNNVEVTGKIIAEAWRGKKKLPILRGWSYEDDDGSHHEVTFYTQRMLDRKTWDEDDILTQEVYGYRLWDEANHREYLILSEDSLGEEEMNGVFSGFSVEKGENLNIGDDLKIGAYANILHIHNIRPRLQGRFEMLKYPEASGTEVEMSVGLKVAEEGIIYKSIENSIFNKYKHPKWFMNLIYYFLLSYPGYEYPFHIFIFQDGSGGKSTLLRHIAKTMGIREADIWSGNKSTLKSLVPSFHTNPPQVGWMPTQRFFGLLDEFFGRQSASHDSADKLYEYDSIKDMLDGNKSESLSAKGSIKTNSTAKFLFSSNLKYGIRDLESFMNRTDAALVERILVYFMNKEHEDFIKDNRESVMRAASEPETFPDSMNFIKHMIIHAQSFKISGVDYDKIKAIREKLVTKNTLDMSKTAAIDNYVNARMTHHLVCLLDGIVKLRYFSHKIYDGEMTPVDNDYVELEMISEIISHSWMNNFDIREFSLDARVRLLRGNSRELYHFIREQGGMVLENDYVVYANDVLKLDAKTAPAATNILLSWGVVIQDGGYFKCYWRTEPKQEKPKAEHLQEPHDGTCSLCGYQKWLEFKHDGNSICKECAFQ